MSIPFRKALVCILLLGIAPLFAHAADRPAAPQYVFGVVPQFEQRKLYAIWTPIIEAVEKRTNIYLRLETTLTIPEFEKEYVAQKFDFAYMNPYYIVRGVAPGTYIPLVRDAKPHRGILVVRKNGPIKKISDLAGKTVAFPTPNALGASLLIRADLERLFGVTVKPLYVKTHSSVYLHVATDLAAAGGGVQKTLQEQDPALRNMLTVLYTTQAMPNLPVAAHRRVPADVREKVRRAFLELGGTEAGRALLAQIPIQEIAPATLEEYLVIGTWGLERYWDPNAKGD